MVATNEGGDRSEIAFFDVETTVPSRTGQGYALLEFGAIWVCPRKLVELRSYATLVRPKDLSQISSRSVRCNGITREAVASAPSFSEIADDVYEFLHGRIWAGHNILRFDCARIREAFAEINRPAPEPKGTIDSLALLTQKFGRRAGDMKMASLATYFGLGKQTHRSLDDVRMNLEVLKNCAAVLFLESSLPDIFTDNSWTSPSSTSRNWGNVKNSTDQTQPDESTPIPIINIENVSTSFSPNKNIMSEDHPIQCLRTPTTGETSLHNTDDPTPQKPSHYDMGTLRFGIEVEPLPEDDAAYENTDEISVHSEHSEGSNGFSDFLEPHEISVPSISATPSPYPGIQRIQLLHNNVPLKLKFNLIKILFGISTRYVDYAGRPRLSIVVNVFRDFCKFLDAVNDLAEKQSIDCGSFSEWQPIVKRGRPKYYNLPSIRMHLPTISEGEETWLTTEIYRKGELLSNRYGAVDLDSLFIRGDIVDVWFSFAAYDYRQRAGLRLIVERLNVYF